MQPKQIELLIADHIHCEKLQVSSDDNVHFNLMAVSKAFVDHNKIQRHRMIYKALGNLMESEIHALSMNLYTPEEFQD